MFKNFFKKTTPEEAFWNWFKSNQDTYYHYDQYDLDSIFDQLAVQLRTVHEDLAFEFLSELRDGKREFVISADGLRSAAPAVIRVVESAPPLDKWNIVAFRPRGSADAVRLGDLTLTLDNILFSSRINEEDGRMLDVDMYVPDFDEEMIGVIFLLLDSLLGEYDVMTKLADIDFHLLEEGKRDRLRPLRELRELVDGSSRHH